MKTAIEKNFDYYLQNYQELSQQHMNKHIIIKDQQVIADADSFMQAYDKATGEMGLEPGAFSIQHCTGTEDGYTIKYYTRPIFA